MVSFSKAVLLHSLAALLSSSVSAVDAECSGHGTKSGGECNCTNPTPGQVGELGYVGEECEIKTFGVRLGGDDVTKTCSASGCNALQPDEWVCFYTPVAWNSTEDIWNYLAVQLNRTSEDDLGDPDLYGLFYEAPPQGKLPDKRPFSYDFQETSNSRHRSVVKRVKKSSYAGHAYEGVYLCVKAYGDQNITFSLRATLSKCPADFTATGEAVVCSSPASAAEKRHTGCTDAGECICKPPYAKPLPQVYEGIGFEDCSARLTPIPDQQFAATHTFVAQHEPPDAAAWSFYRFNVSQDDYQIVINAAGESNKDGCAMYGYFGAFAKFGQPPSPRYDEWDFRPQWTSYREDDDLEISFDPTDPGFQTGEWYVGVNNEDSSNCKYTLTISKYDCPMNCTNQGSCVVQSNGSHTCQCNSGFFGPDCSLQTAALVYGSQITKPASSFEYEFYELPPISEAMVSHPVEVRFTASFESSTYAPWTAARPELLLLKGDEHSLPSVGNHTYKAVLDEQNRTYDLDLCPSQLRQGVWRAAIYNPVRVYKIGYNLTVSKQGLCLNNCSGHGTCTDDGVCQCASDWAGGDCSVNTAGTSCQEGTRQAVPRPEQKGTCWQACRCGTSGDCRFEESCADFTCDTSDLRRKGTEAVCVKDDCTQDAWQETEAYGCLRRCACPADGSSCALSSGCKADSMACKQGYRQFSDGRAACFHVGCEEGTLAETARGAVDNGKAYGQCQCGTSADERDDRPLCSVPETDPERLTIVCEAGYSLKGAVRKGQSSAWIGGTCVKSNHGTPAWGVVLWVFFSLLVGGAGGVGLLWYYEYKLRAPSVQDSLYQELSMDTGF